MSHLEMYADYNKKLFKLNLGNFREVNVTCAAALTPETKKLLAEENLTESEYMVCAGICTRCWNNKINVCKLVAFRNKLCINCYEQKFHKVDGALFLPNPRPLILNELKFFHSNVYVFEKLLYENSGLKKNELPMTICMIIFYEYLELKGNDKIFKDLKRFNFTADDDNDDILSNRLSYLSRRFYMNKQYIGMLKIKEEMFGTLPPPNKRRRLQ